MRIWRVLALAALAMVVWFSVGIALKLKIWPMLAVPVLVVGGLQVIYNYKPIFFLMVFAIPCSLHIELGDIAIDAFSEPLMIVFLLIFIINILRGQQFSLHKPISTFHFLLFLLLVLDSIY